MKFIYFNQKYYSTLPYYDEDNNAIFIPEPWLVLKKPLLRKLCHFHLSPRINSRISIPLKRIWFSSIVDSNFDKEDSICIIINSHFYHLYYAGLLSYIKKKYKKCKFVFVFSDTVSYFINHYKDFPAIEKLRSDFDMVITYNINDSKKYAITLDRPCIPKELNSSNILGDFYSDLFFVGSNKNRLKELLDIFEFCKKNGIKCDFHITNVDEKDQKYSDEIIYNSPMSYLEVVERSKKTKCILNVVQENGEGVTLRDYEAIKFNKLTLTNNYALKTTGLYTEKQVIWLSELRNRVSEIKTGYNGYNSFEAEFSQNRWFEWLESCLEKRNNR